MNSTVTARKPSSSIAAIPALAAIVAVFVLGGVGGYAVKALTGSDTAVQPRVASAAAPICPAGTHVAVWYSAGTWSCLEN
jgi:hypothetical protein